MSYLKHNDIPFMTKGRWYAIFLESNGSNITITRSEIEECTMSGTKLMFPHDMQSVEEIMDVHLVEGATGSYGHTINITASGAWYLTLPPASTFDYATIYIFGRRE